MIIKSLCFFEKNQQTKKGSREITAIMTATIKNTILFSSGSYAISYPVQVMIKGKMGEKGR